MSRVRCSDEEQEATDLVFEFLERGMVPAECIDDVKASMANGEPIQALGIILEAR